MTSALLPAHPYEAECVRGQHDAQQQASIAWLKQCCNPVVYQRYGGPALEIAAVAAALISCWPDRPTSSMVQHQGVGVSPDNISALLLEVLLPAPMPLSASLAQSL